MHSPQYCSWYRQQKHGDVSDIRKLVRRGTPTDYVDWLECYKLTSLRQKGRDSNNTPFHLFDCVKSIWEENGYQVVFFT